jgi:hypothetical protein
MSLGHGETVKSACEIDNLDVVEALAAATTATTCRASNKAESLMPPMSLTPRFSEVHADVPNQKPFKRLNPRSHTPPPV